MLLCKQIRHHPAIHSFGVAAIFKTRLSKNTCRASSSSTDSQEKMDQHYKHGLRSLSKEHNPRGCMQETMKRLGTIETAEMPGKSAFVKPYTIFYELDGKRRRWDAVQSHGSVGALVYHKEFEGVIIVRQFRPAVYAWSKLEAEAAGKSLPPLANAFTYELCAGIIDKEKSLEELTMEEIREETGFNVDPSSLKQITTYNSAVGTSGSLHYMFTADVDESMRFDGGGGLQDTGEAIEVLLLPLKSALEFVADSSLNKSAGLLFGLMWLYHRETAKA